MAPRALSMRSLHEEIGLLLVSAALKDEGRPDDEQQSQQSVALFGL